MKSTLLLCCILLSVLVVAYGRAIRRNVLDLTDEERTQWVKAVLALKHEIDPKTNISTYDSYVLEHSHNSIHAHMGPAFLPWHRMFLLNFEKDLQRVSDDPNLTLPYWDWSNNVTRMDIWTPSFLGGNGTDPDSRIHDGPFADWGITYERNDTTSHGIRRAWGTPIGTMPDMHHDMGNTSIPPVLPPLEDLVYALSLPLYDTPPYNDSSHSPPSFRNTFEGWEKTGCRLHNQIHLWVGGHMRMVAISVNDPVFWLHHSFVDKVFSLWQTHQGKHIDAETFGYVPLSGAREGHNLYDEMVPFGVKPFDVLDIDRLGYGYQEDEIDKLLGQLISDRDNGIVDVE